LLGKSSECKILMSENFLVSIEYRRACGKGSNQKPIAS
jgi:hypothetical protein